MEVINEYLQSPVRFVDKRKFRSNTTKKCSHLYLQEKGLKNIPKLVPSKDIVVLYLFNNNITKIENLNGFTNLTSLYLQNNNIEHMENFKNLTCLKKLYIGHNKISVLEGLENLSNLEELHIEKQNLPDNNSLCVDPRTIRSLSESLQILNISNNNLYELSHLSALENLRVIYAASNDLDDIKEVCKTICKWYHLKEATFTGNPFARKHRYREDIIANSCNLEILDGKIITDITRRFIRRFEEEKLMHGSRQSININICQNLPTNYPPPLRKAVSVAMIRNSNVKLLQDADMVDENDEAVYIPWKALPKRKPSVKTPLRLNKKLNVNKLKKRVVINSFPQISNI